MAPSTSMMVVLVLVSTSDPSVITPGLEPGEKVPLTVTGPLTVPVPISQAEAATERPPEPSEPLTLSLPADTVVAPE